MPDGNDPPVAPTLTPSQVSAATEADGEPGQAGPHAAVPGYRLGERIGKGGMGEVVIAHDLRIGRDVALKRLRAVAPQAGAVARFLREARLQARLEHPAIVPVHELGRDPDGKPYFTMQRLAGITLAGVLAAVEPSRQRLLRAFADVCLAIEFAHARGVVHRDVKPANIMLGDFGEVYVLDWGLARVVGDGDGELAVGADVESLDGMTLAGAVLGTPGYMPPEQIQGAHDVGPEADVYALGAILFELLAGESLHPRGQAALPTTLAGIDGSPARRRPDRNVPPELDAVCVEALAQDPRDRPTARELAHSIERYLDGDRDVEHRRGLAASHLVSARVALAAGQDHRAEAAQFASRALALDPESAEAAELVTALALEPPGEIPPALRDELERAEGEVQRRQSRTAKMSFLAIFAYLVIAAWNGLHAAAVLVVIGAFAAVLFEVQRRLQRRTATRREMLLVALGNAMMAALLSRMFGPLLVVPSVCCVMALSMSSYPQLVDRARSFVLPLLIAAWLGPVALEYLGLLAPTWDVVPGAVISTSNLVQIGGRSTVALLVFANVLAIVVVTLFANALARSRRDAMRQAVTQAWQMRQLVPAPRPRD